MSEVVEDSEQRVDRLLKQIQSGHASNEIEMPENGPFRPVHFDDRIKLTVGIIMEFYNIAPESEVKLADISDIIANKKKFSRDTARKYVLAALTDAAVVSAPGKPTFVRGLVPK
jgi:hypothetical protein